MRGTLCLSKMCFQASLWGPFSPQLWSSQTFLTILSKASGAWDWTHLFNSARLGSHCSCPYSEECLSTLSLQSLISPVSGKKCPLSPRQLLIIHNNRGDQLRLWMAPWLLLFDFEVIESRQKIILKVNNFYENNSSCLFPRGRCMASLLWYLEREADGRMNASACSALILLSEVLDIYGELHRTCLHALLSDSERGLFFSLWIKYLLKSMKIIRSVANIWNYHFRVPIISTVKAKVHIVILHEWSGLLFSLWLCFPLTHSASAPQAFLLVPQNARYPLEWLLLKNRK